MSGKARKADAGWAGRSVARLRPADVTALVAGEIPYIRVPRYLSPEWCVEVVRRFAAAPPEEHDYGVTKSRTLGMSLVGFIKSGTPTGPYFDRVPRVVEALRSVYRGGTDPLLRLREEFAACTGWEGLAPEENGRAYASDIIGEIPSGFGLPLHCDSPWGLPGMAVSRFPLLLSWNVYLSASEQGGKLVIYRSRPSKGDDDSRLKGKGAGTAAVAGAAAAEFMPSRGDLILYNSADYHEVQVSSGASSRITAHSWISADPARKRFAFWS